MSVNSETEELLKPVIGRHLSAVAFAREYVELQFDWPTRLTAITWPVVTVEHTRYEYGQPGYRDMLCECITKIVRLVSVKEGDEIRIDFNDGSLVTIPLNPEDRCGPKATIFHSEAEDTWAL